MSTFELSDEQTSHENIKVGNAVFLYSNSLPISFQTKILKHDQDHIRLRNNVPHAYILEFNKGESYELNTGLQKYSAKNVQSDGENIIFPISNSENVAETRSEPRTYFHGEDQIYCLITNPYDQITTIKKPLIDISKGGFGLTTDFDSKFFNPKTKIEKCTIYTNNQKHIECSCEVVYKRKYHSLLDKTSIQVGFKYIDKVEYD